MLTRRSVLLASLAGAAASAGACSAPAAERDQGQPPAAPSPSAPSSVAPSSAAAPDPASPLPAAKSLLESHRLIGFSGAPGAAALGRMTGDLNAASAALRKQIGQFHGDRPVKPIVELIATVAQGGPGADGKYRTRGGDDTIRRYLDAARKLDGLLLLGVQPGRADFLPEVKFYERWLKEPDVGLALDPEWAVEGGAVPGQKFGHTTGGELDGVAGYLSGLVATHRLPEKVLVYHQVASSVVTEEDDLREHPGVALVKSVDGIGSPQLKRGTWDKLMKAKPDHVHPGFKLFFDEDTRNGSPLMSPKDVLALRPEPAYVLYE